jgi:CheY-like chemotaxis protein
MTKRAAEQGTELVRRLLAFARRQNLEPQAIDLGALKDAVADLLIHTLGGLVEIEWRIGPDVWDAFADQTQLELALVNLIINARDAMPAGGTVTISAENCQSCDDELPGIGPGQFVRLAVTDTGTGISPEDLENVMEPFFTTKEVGKGSGLGLSMVYGFAKQSNGSFRIASELGTGTIAELWLPRAPADSSTDTPAPPKRQRRSSNRKLRILLVDDHDQVRHTTAALLTDLGHTVVEAANGGDALEAMRNSACNFDVLISDYAMPQLSGTDFLRQARTLCPGVPGLIITGYAQADAISDRPDGVQILLKPFTEASLDAAIEEACRRTTIVT